MIGGKVIMFPKWVIATLLLVSTTIVASLGRITFDRFVGPAHGFLIPFFLPVVVTALFFGSRWGLLAIIVNGAIIAYFFTTPVHSFTIQNLEDQVRIGSFLVLGSLLIGFAGSLRYHIQKTEEQISEALRKSEQKFRAVFHSQFQFIGLMSPDGVLLEANRTALSAAGVTEDAVIGKPFWETAWWSHDPVQQQRLRDAVLHAAAGHLDRFEASHPLADGSLMWVDFSLTPYLQDGRVVLLIPEGRDITERKRAEAAVKESEQRFQSFMMHAPISAWIVNAESCGVYTNPGFDKQLGLTPGAFVGRIPADLWPPEIAEAYVENNRRVLAEGVIETEEPFVRLDGTEGVAHVVKFPMSGPQGQQLIGGVAIDITVRKNAEASLKLSEERFRLAVEATGMGVWDTVVPFAELGWDNRLKHIFGLPPEAVVDTATMIAIIHPDDRGIALKVHSEAVDPLGSGVLKTEFRIINPEGERWVSAWDRQCSRTI